MKQSYINAQNNLGTKVLAARQLDFVQGHICGAVLDIGCGDGILGAIYGGQVTSCDIEDINKYGIRVDVSPAENLPYADDAFDTVCLIGVIEHVNNPALAISECRRVLRPGGKLIMTYPRGFGWWFLKKVFPRDGIRLHADFRMNGEMSGWQCVHREAIVPMFFVGEVWQ